MTFPMPQLAIDRHSRLHAKGQVRERRLADKEKRYKAADKETEFNA